MLAGTAQTAAVTSGNIDTLHSPCTTARLDLIEMRKPPPLFGVNARCCSQVTCPSFAPDFHPQCAEHCFAELVHFGIEVEQSGRPRFLFVPCPLSPADADHFLSSPIGALYVNLSGCDARQRGIADGAHITHSTMVIGLLKSMGVLRASNLMPNQATVCREELATHVSIFILYLACEKTAPPRLSEISLCFVSKKCAFEISLSVQKATRRTAGSSWQKSSITSL